MGANFPELDKLLLRMLVLDHCDRENSELSELKSIAQEIGINGDIDNAARELVAEDFLAPTICDARAGFKRRSSGKCHLDRMADELFIQEELLQFTFPDCPEFALQLRQNQNVKRQQLGNPEFKRIWAHLEQQEYSERILNQYIIKRFSKNLSAAADDVYADVRVTSSEIAKIIRGMNDCSRKGLSLEDKARHLLAVKAYLLTAIFGWPSKSPEVDYLLIQDTGDGRIKAILIMAAPHGATAFSKAGLGRGADSVWRDAEPAFREHPLPWIKLAGVRRIGLEVTEAVFSSMKAVVADTDSAWADVRLRWENLYPKTAIERLTWQLDYKSSRHEIPKPPNRRRKCTKPEFTLKYWRDRKRFAQLIDHRGRFVWISQDALNFLLAYVNKRTGLPLDYISPVEVVTRAILSKERPSAGRRTPERAVVQWFHTIQKLIKAELDDLPEGLRSEILEKISAAMFHEKPRLRRKLTFALVKAKGESKISSDLSVARNRFQAKPLRK